jgi:alanine racemase
MKAHGHRLSAIARALGTTVQGDGYDPVIEHLVIDSRKPLPEEGALFIALKGDRHDGHRYLPDLVERGLQCAVVSDTTASVPLTLCVPDTLDALQRLAGWHRAHFDLPVVGITGSNGKTVVKEWLYQLLRADEHIVRSPGSWNSQVGVPLSAWEIRPEHTLGIFEAGISLPGEMARLQAVVRPTIGVFTNIGPAHGANFGSDLEKALEKAHLFKDAKALILCADHEVIAQAIDKCQLDQRLTLRAWSRDHAAWLHVVREEPVPHGKRITCINDNTEFTFEIPFADHASVENALHCVTLLLHLGMDTRTIAERMPLLQPVAMRLEVLEGRHGITLINDAYSNDLASLTVALEHLDVVGRGRPKAVVISDIVGSGDERTSLYQRMAALMRRAGVHRILTVGPELAERSPMFNGQAAHYTDAADLIRRCDPMDLAGHAVLIKGARSFALEHVVHRWQRQVHGTVLEIDLEAIRHNLNHYRAQLAGGTRVMAMVKAFGYGSGALELARLFAHEQVHYLGVAYADEGIELRQQGIQLPILVMNPEPVPFEVLDRYRLEAEVYDERSLLDAADHARLHPGTPPVHIKLDTGMHRLGFMPAELPNLLQLLKEHPHLRIASVLSHLAASEDPAHDAFTRQQIAQFSAMADAIEAALGYRPFRHIANSAAVRRFPEARFDLVRLGIGLHGIGADASESAHLLPAASLRTPIAQLRHVPKGDSVSYGRRWVAQRPSLIATVPLGYADGLSRRLGNGVGRLWVHGSAAPIVGSVCMDMCMVDVTDIPCHIGDMAYLFNAEHPVTEVARDLGTIAYEVLTGIAQRVKRIHMQG